MKKGFTLLEVIIAITLLLIGVTGTLVLITRTASQANLFPSRLIASYLTQEGIEIIRNIRDTNWLEQATDPSNLWDEGLTNCSIIGCEADYTATAVEDPESAVPPRIAPYANLLFKIDTNGVYSYSGTTDTKFTRKITIVSEDVTVPPDGINELKVTVETAWREKGTNYSHRAHEILYNWR